MFSAKKNYNGVRRRAAVCRKSILSVQAFSANVVNGLTLACLLSRLSEARREKEPGAQIGGSQL